MLLPIELIFGTHVPGGPVHQHAKLHLSIITRLEDISDRSPEVPFYLHHLKV